MTEVATGRRRYRWLLLLLVAAILVAWLLTGGGQQDDPEPSGGGTTTSSSPTHELTVTTTPTSDPTGTGGIDPDSGLPIIQVAVLPAEARDVLDRIDRGGPFKYADNDGVTFENREDLLPDQPMGYYREYTVETAPRERGPRRIVAGDGGERYYTGDHYRSFSRIASPS
jgi:ribonuclease T1